MLFKFGVFLICYGLLGSIYYGFFLFSSDANQYVVEYRFNKTKGLPLTAQMQSAYVNWKFFWFSLVMYISGVFVCMFMVFFS